MRTAISAHVTRCEQCRSALERVGGLREVMSSMAPDPLDDLSWARLARRVQAELRAPEPTTLSLRTLASDWLRWWAPVAVVAATGLATALVISVWPRAPGPAGGSGAATGALAAPGSGDRSRDARVDLAASSDEDQACGAVPVATMPLAGPSVRSGAPLEITLGNGLKLRLGGDAAVRVVESGLARVALELDEGEIEVWSPDDRGGPEVVLRAPDLVAVSQGGARFRVARLAGAPTALQVERGAVRVTRPGTDPAAPAAAPTTAEAPRSSPPRPRPVARVEPVEPWERALRAYEAGRLEDAVAHAEASLRVPHDAAQAHRAWSLVCDANLALDRPADAAAACEKLLLLVDGDEARAIHFRVATIYRARLRDCARARLHYDQMVVVGSTALVDQDALLGRAECALMAGDLDGAARDLGFLRGQALARPAAYDVLVDRLGAARETLRGNR